MYGIAINPELEKELIKLTQKNPKQVEIILKKTAEIQENPHRYKNLRKPLNHLKRVHIDKHFVLTFSIDEINKKIVLDNYEHHNKIYRI